MDPRPSPSVIVEPLEPRKLLSAAVVGTPTLVNASREPASQTDEAIAVNPNNRLQLFLATSNAGSSLLGMTSSDGGHTWSKKIFATGADFPVASGVPSVSWDSFGNLFLAYRRADTGTIEILYSTDAASSFHVLTNIATSGDRPTIATGDGEVWIAFQQNPGGGAPAKIANAGAVAYGAAVTGLGHIGKPKAIEAISGPLAAVGGLAIGPAGQVAVVYQYEGLSGPVNIFTSVDPDGLGHKQFGVANTQVITNAASIPPGATTPLTDFCAASIAYDDSTDAFAGRLYMAYEDAPTASTGGVTINLRYSDDDGATWSAPVKVNDDNTTDSHFLPRVAVDPTTGAVGIVWYDARNDTTSQTVQVWGAVGTPTATGVTLSPNFDIQSSASTVFTTTPVTNPVTLLMSNVTTFNLGDYIGLTFFKGQMYPAWADNSNSTGDNPDGTAATDAYVSDVTVQVTTTPTRTFLGAFSDSAKLTVTESDGTADLFTIRHGVGYAFQDGNNIDLRILDTDSTSTVTVRARGGSDQVRLGSVWVAGSIGSVVANNSTLVGTLSVQGAVKRATFASITGGTFAATGAIGSITTSSLTNAKILSGANPGTDGVFAGAGDTDDTFAAGSIDSIRVRGAIAASFIGAGVNPVDGVFGNGNDTIIGGAASSIRTLAAGSADSASRFEAGSFKTVRLLTPIDPATDSRFLVD